MVRESMAGITIIYCMMTVMIDTDLAALILFQEVHGQFTASGKFLNVNIVKSCTVTQAHDYCQ